MARHLSLQLPPDADPAKPRRVVPRRNGRAKQPGLRDVARAAEVSLATVSLVLNGSPRISDATRSHVRGVMDELGYQPNRLAQSLGGRYVKAVAAILPDLRHAFADAYFGELLSGITDEAQDRGFKIFLEQAKPDYLAANRHVELFEQRYVDGVLLLGHTDKSGHARDLAGGDYPAVVVDNRLDLGPDCRLDSVRGDYAAAAQQVMSYLAQLGHRRVGLLHAAPDIATVREVRDAWCDRLRQLGVEPCDTMTRDGRFTEKGGAEATADLMKDHPDTTAILAMSDKMAIGAMHHLHRAGVRVPGEVSVIGFDDLPHASYVSPALTTVNLPLYDVGRRSMARLIERVEGRTDVTADVLPAHLVIRDSTAIARDAGRNSNGLREP